jgi:hypothetical protein
VGNANRLVGYLASVTTATLFYVVWVVVQNWTPASHVTVLFSIGIAFFFWLFGGLGAAFVLMALPWYLAVVWQRRLQRFGLYFPVIGAATTMVIACCTSSLSPKPLFVDDQTFIEGFTIAVQRQGICLLLTGFVFGLTFWLVSERLRHTHSMETS